jgi:Domain of unknown function (DUF4410)
MGRPFPAGWMVLVLCLCGGAATAQQGVSAPPPELYVADFELDIENGGADVDPAGRARELIDLMASSLVRDFTMIGFKAQRIAPDEPLPRTGWLVRGVFVRVEDGNRFQRLALGPATGGNLQVVAIVDDLVHGTPKAIYEIERRGTAASIRFNPYAIAVRFALSGTSLQRNVTRSAGEISREIIVRARQ